MPSAEYSENHVWVVASLIRVDARQAARSVLRHSLRFPKEIKVNVIETYCEQCRRPWDDVVDELCVAAEGNEHLRGGPIGKRKKRLHNHDCGLLGCERSSAEDDGEEPLGATG